MSALEDLLLFRSVSDPVRRTLDARLLDDSLGAERWRPGGEADLWELYEAACGPDDGPVAAAATRPLGDGMRVMLVAAVVAPDKRGTGLGQRMLEELADSLRASGVLVLVTAVPSDAATAMVVVQRAGFRPSHVERGCPGSVAVDRVWFDLHL